MFIYLSKKIKIAIPNPIPLHSITWNQENGWIACGGEEGMLKIIRLESAGDKGGSNLTMNQTLPGHNGRVEVATWNENYRKLTTSDQHGLIIVWMLYKDQWHEEMINNRNKSFVTDMKWNSDGQRICIAYDDGDVIVGQVDGERLWGKPLNMKLRQVEWSPNGKSILFGTGTGDVYHYNEVGDQVGKLNMVCLEGASGGAVLKAITWYNGTFGYMQRNAPVLAICYENGRMQLMRDLKDSKPVLVDAMMTIKAAKWNHNGTVLAVAGMEKSEDDDSEICAVQFYNTMGEHKRTLQVPGNNITSLAWELGSLKLCLTVDNFIYFANVRPDYLWGHFTNTVVYAFSKPQREEHCVIFWDVKRRNRIVKYVKNLINIAALGDHCILCTKADDNTGQYVLILCNSLGTPIDSKYMDVEPIFVSMSQSHVVAASHNCAFVWNYTSAKTAEGKSRKRDERIFHIDDAPTGGKDTDPSRFKKINLETRDPICAVCISDRMVMIARTTGTLHQYGLPKVALEMKHVVKSRPDRISLNSNSSRLAILDIDGVLTFFDPEAKRVNPETGSVVYGQTVEGFERKDVWDIRWADDNPSLFAMMERSYMYIFRGLDPDEPIASNAYISHFSNLQVESVALDEIMRDPEHPTKNQYFEREIKALRDTNTLLDTVTIEDAYSYIEQNPHPRLWRLLAESALSQMDLEIADKAFVRCQDLAGIHFVQHLQQLGDIKKQEAEVAAYFQRFDEAQQLYMEADRSDLAINMRQKLGDWFRVIQLIRSSGGADDKQLKSAWSSIGQYYFDRQQYKQAKEHFSQGGNTAGLAECCYRLEDWHGLEELIYTLPEGHELLKDIGSKFATVGLSEQAAKALVKADDVKEAINACVRLNQWDLAVELADTHKVSEIDSLLSKYATHLLGKNKIVEAVELYRKANAYLDAAKLLFQMAQEGAKAGRPILRSKQLYVLGALQVEEYQERSTGSTLDGLLEEDQLDDDKAKIIENAWRGAEAYHFLMLAQRQLYSGKFNEALKTAVRVTEYDDLVDPVQAYSVLALAAAATRNYGLCSKAFVKLESLGEAGSKAKEQYESLATAIFSKHPPRDTASGVIVCPQCSTKNPDWRTSCTNCSAKFLPSIASGRPMVELEYWICGRCKRRAGVSQMAMLRFCPLCHTPV
eukprot:TRINITY_DN10757_c0_g1_i2.p1 TRINITY_DN10757_c0_g1~~TRINITY_DN10757_c0_g1_i2.p1  ORF type:complete len:1157 (+),score=402.04 TRINITY_DN10757_c0_g1_i2:149-3619(+)